MLASTMAFGTLCLGRLFHGFNCKSEYSVFKTKRLWDNIYLIGAFLLGLALITAVMVIPVLQSIFQVRTLGLTQLLTVYGLAFLTFPVIQVIKWIRHR